MLRCLGLTTLNNRVLGPKVRETTSGIVSPVIGTLKVPSSRLTFRAWPVTRCETCSSVRAASKRDWILIGLLGAPPSFKGIWSMGPRFVGGFYDVVMALWGALDHRVDRSPLFRKP